jgi:diguanylate cyclase (GGDEF)-like protein
MDLNMQEFEDEREHSLKHLFVVIGISLGIFIFIGNVSQNFGKNLLLLKLIFGGLSLFVILHYAFINRFPDVLIGTRKFLLILLDIVAVSISIIILGKFGLFLLPLYILIVMESGVNFGLGYFYASLFFSCISWVMLLAYSDYWDNHLETIVIFAITTFIIPLVYLKKMMYLHQAQKKLHKTLIHTDYEAKYDTLTGLPNRKNYDNYMKNLLKERSFFALLFIDLNKFKTINDTYGHDAGDAVLVEVAKRLKRSLSDEDMLARLGGDEFVILTKRKKAFLAKFIEKLEKTTIGMHSIGEIEVLIELSIGISLFPDDSKSESLLRKYADEAMYCAKKRRDTYHVFYEEIKPKIESSENIF